MVDLGTSGYLLFSAMWTVPDADLDALRREIAIRIDEPDVDRVRLSFASITAPRCHALIGDGSGAFQTVATSTTSGVPPYDAAFNLFLQNERLVHARAGLRGEAGFLALEYLADLQVLISAMATFRSIAIELLPWIRSQSADRRDLRQLLDEAVERGLAAVAIDAPDDQVGQIAINLYDRVLGQVARALPRWLEQDTAGDINVAVALDQHVNEPIRAFADIGAIVAMESARGFSGGQDAAD